MTEADSNLRLESVAGEPRVVVDLPDDGTLTLGRRPDNDVVFDAPPVSRRHAEIAPSTDAAHAGWTLIDLGSRHGTSLNGRRLQPNDPLPIEPGDLIGIGPWTLAVRTVEESARSTVTMPISELESAGSRIRSVRRDDSALVRERLQLLLNFAESISSAANIEQLAETVLEVSLLGTRYSNAALLRPPTSAGNAEVIAHRHRSGGSDSFQLSRTLLREAAQGRTVQMTSDDEPMSESVTLMKLNISEAICVPLLSESTLLGLLYLDNRVGQTIVDQTDTREAGAFADAVGRLSSIALANLMRQDVERRLASMRGELLAAATAQQSILPARIGDINGVSYIGECRPGRVVSGDFFDVIALDDNRVAVTLGDVAGKGVAASVLMTTSQGFLQGALREHDIQRVMDDLNRYLYVRSEQGRFVTMWIGVFDSSKQSLTYVNAGHGYALLVDDAKCTQLDQGGGPPVGILDRLRYEPVTIELPKSAAVVLVSDGVVEQTTVGRGTQPGSAEQFGLAGVEKVLCQQDTDGDHVAQVFSALESFAGGTSFADDATIVSVNWKGKAR